MSIFHNMFQAICDTAFVWKQEMKQVFHDEGVLMFMLIVPLAYPLLYSWIYNNEAVHEVPVVVVDQSHSALSRQFIRDCDATPDVKVLFHADDLDEAQSLVSRQLVKGVYLIPSDFASSLSRMEQTSVSVYCDMSLMLTYKAIYQTAVMVSQRMGAGIRAKLAGNYTSREDQLTVQPMAVDGVAMYNPSGGYGSCVIPGVLMLILQQTLVLGVGMSAGTSRENNPGGHLIPRHPAYCAVGRIVVGKALCYAMIYAVMGSFLALVIPSLFHFPMFGHGSDLLLMMIPYVLASIFFAMTVSCLVRYRENVMLLMVFVSVPLLFMSGVSWPKSNIPGIWQGVSWLFPSTFGIRSYVGINSMGATIDQVMPEIKCLWIQVAAYFTAACLVYGYHLRMSRKLDTAL